MKTIKKIIKKIIIYLWLFYTSLTIGFTPQSGIKPTFNHDINNRFKQYTNQEMLDILREILRFENKDRNDLTKEVRELTRSAYDFVQRNSYKDIYYLGWTPFYNENKKVYNTPYYFVFLDKVPVRIVYMDYVFQNPLWFDIYKKAHINNVLFFSDLEVFAHVGNYTLNTDRLKLSDFRKFELAFKHDTEVFYS